MKIKSMKKRDNELFEVKRAGVSFKTVAEWFHISVGRAKQIYYWELYLRGLKPRKYREEKKKWIPYIYNPFKGVDK